MLTLSRLQGAYTVDTDVFDTKIGFFLMQKHMTEPNDQSDIALVL